MAANSLTRGLRTQERGALEERALGQRGHGKSSQHDTPDRIRCQQGGGGGQGGEGAVAQQQVSVAHGGEMLRDRIEPAADPVAVRRCLDLQTAADAQTDDDRIVLADAQQRPCPEGGGGQQSRERQTAPAHEQLDQGACGSVAQDPLQLALRQPEP